MAKVLRHYQTALKAGIVEAWRKGATVAMGVTATGSGKTVTMGSLAHDHADEPGVIVAHRSELVSQISLAMADEGLRHNIVASESVKRGIVEAHFADVGRNMYDPRAAWTVASVGTILRRTWEKPERVRYAFIDEAHHITRANIWGKAMLMFPKAKGLGMTATPTRADGMGLGSHHDGIVDALVIGPGLADLTAQGFLTGYNVAAPLVSDLDISDVHMGANGEFNQAEAARAVKRSKKIIGDVVGTYRDLALGKLAILFAADIDHARALAAAFVAASIPAEVVTGDDTDADRRAALARFKARKTLVLVNVGLFSEGFDVPAVEVVIMAALTASFVRYAQMIGRMLRLDVGPVLMGAWDTFTPAQRHAFIAASAKPKGLLIDLVGNVYREYKVGDSTYSGLPEGFTAWTLDRRDKRAGKSPAGDRICTGCYQPYATYLDNCPHCGAMAPEPTARLTPKQVDGNVMLLSPEVLAVMRGEVARIDGVVRIPQGLSGPAIAALTTKHHERQVAQANLRSAIATWAGKNHKYSDAENYRRFFQLYDIDVISAMALNASGATKLLERITQ